MMKKTRAQAYCEEENSRIDLLVVLFDLGKGMRKFWWQLILVCIFVTGFTCLITKLRYTPQYYSDTTFTVSVRTGTSEGNSTYGFYYNTQTAEQLNQLFPVILRSDALKELILDDLGMEEMPGILSVYIAEGSNLVTMGAVSIVPETAQKLLQSAVNCFPEISYYVIGESQFHILKEATLPQAPYNTPNYFNEAVKGMMAALIVCLLFLGVYSLFRKTVITVKDCRELLHLQPEGRIPLVYFKKHGKKFDKTLDFQNDRVGVPFQEGIGSLALHVERKMRESGRKSLLVTSTLTGEGKTAIAWNLAKCLAESGNRVLLVDANLQKPSLVKMSTNMKTWGLPEVLENVVSEAEAICRPGNESLYVIGGDKSYDKSLVLLHSEKFAAWMRQKQTEYDYIILDGGACGVTADAMAAAEICDAVLYVIFCDMASQSQILNSLEKLRMYNKEQLTIAVLNGVSGTPGRYQKYYGGKYNHVPEHSEKA